MVKVRAYRISSVNDPETGQPGKQIELVEVRSRPAPQLFSVIGEDEAKLVKGIMGQFQQMGIFPVGREIVIPKITLFLTEAEYDLLATRFEVNDTFDLLIKDGAFMLKRSTEGV